MNDASPNVKAKAQRLLDENRVVTYIPTGCKDEYRARVAGDHGNYIVRITADGADCTCQAAQSRVWCSHGYATLVAWSERLAQEAS